MLKTSNTLPLPWNMLTSDEQKTYIDKAGYLIEKGYMRDIEVEELAQHIYTLTVVQQSK